LSETIHTLIENLAIWQQSLIVFALSMFPVLDRIAIVAARAVGLPWYIALPVLIAGNITPIPFILLFIRKIFAFLRRFRIFGKIIDKLERHAAQKSDKVRRYQFFGLTLFVAIPLPLPGTGAWTGALVAVMMGTRFKHALIAIALGSVIFGVLATASVYGLLSLVTCA
jgi:uncharacterized membrane protein